MCLTERLAVWPAARGARGAKDLMKATTQEGRTTRAPACSMETVLQSIVTRKQQYRQLPLFQFLRDDRHAIAERLAFYPCMAHFILSFGDLNTYVLRREPAPDVHQARVNRHTYEDDHHWPWYLEDYATLGFDRPLCATTLLRHLWSEETRQTRLLMYQLTAMIDRASSVERLAIIEAIEATGEVLFSALLPLAQTLEAQRGVALRYCGNHHFQLESGHSVGSAQDDIAAIALDAPTQARCLQHVAAVFASFEAWTHELLRYASTHPLVPVAVP